jgi:membrane-associated protein
VADFFKQILNFVGTFNLQLVGLLFLLCSFGELWLISVPYLLETVWLLAGYNLGSGTLSPLHLLLLWLVAQLGRQTGVLVLFSLSRLGSLPLTRLYRKYVETRFRKLSGNENWLSKLLKRSESYISPFSIALGRLLGLGTPLTVTLGVKRQYKALFLGVLLSSLVFDGIFIILGLVVGANTLVKPTEMILFSLIGLTGLYVVIFAIRQASRFIKSRWITRNNRM